MPETRLQMLRRWRKVVSELVEVVGRLYPEAKVYLVGGAAEDRLTVLSDVDVAVVFNRKLGGEERAEILARIWEELEKRGVPSYYPLHILVLSEEELGRLLGRKVRLTQHLAPPQAEGKREKGE